MDPKICERIARFKSELATEPTTSIVRKHITFGSVFVFDEPRHFELKAEVAEHFQVHPNEVVLVGSSKLGFSIAPNKRYQPFGNQSDIDVAIVSDTIFDRIWNDVFEYRTDVGYWSGENKFKDYLFQGWIRPDKLPPSDRFAVHENWWKFFRRITSSGAYGNYPIKGGLYKSWHFLESYQSICVDACRSELEISNVEPSEHQV